MIDDWKEFLRLTPSGQDIKILQQHERTGRPLGSDGFLTRIEKSIGRLLKPKRPGRKPRKDNKYVWCPQICRLKHYSIHTERTYCDWITRYKPRVAS